jgi:hypothetical protein
VESRGSGLGKRHARSHIATQPLLFLALDHAKSIVVFVVGEVGAEEAKCHRWI